MALPLLRNAIGSPLTRSLLNVAARTPRTAQTVTPTTVARRGISNLIARRGKALGKTEAPDVPDVFRPLFDDFFKPLERSFFPRVMGEAVRGGNNGSAFGAVEMSETETSHIFTADTPGMKADDIKVSVKDNVLTFSGTRRQELTKEDKEHNIYYNEKSYGTFSRSFILPENVDKKKIEATCKDGVLKVTIPKLSPTPPNEFEVKVGGHDEPPASSS